MLGDDEVEEEEDGVLLPSSRRDASSRRIALPDQRWPVFVHVARLLVPYEGQDVVRNNQVESIAWAELYATEEAARARAM